MVQPPSLWEELTRTEEIAKAEALVVRERLIQTFGIVNEESFKLENYFVKIFGHNLEEMVELSPLTWLPLIPVVAQGRSIDLSRNIVSASSPNAFGSCGEFLSSTGYVTASSFFVAMATIWGVWNFWKMVQIKHMLVPTLVRDTAARGSAVLLPPRYQDEQQLAKFQSSPFPFNVVESFFTTALMGGKQEDNGNNNKNNEGPSPPSLSCENQEALFGAAGRHGPDLYRNSIKVHTWFVVAQLVFYSSQIVARDLAALPLVLQSQDDMVWEQVGRPDLVQTELALYGLYCGLAVGLLWLVPKTFLDYSLVTSIETLVSAPVLTDACLLDGLCEVPPYEENEMDEAVLGQVAMEQQQQQVQSGSNEQDDDQEEMELEQPAVQVQEDETKVPLKEEEETADAVVVTVAPPLVSRSSQEQVEAMVASAIVAASETTTTTTTETGKPSRQSWIRRKLLPRLPWRRQQQEQEETESVSEPTITEQL